jgi:hypothetical protein
VPEPWTARGTDDRPAGDRLLSWHVDDRLVWWRNPSTPNGPYLLVTSDSAGGGDQVLMRVTPPDGVGTRLASWAPGGPA